ncbi:glycoside hydrolase family 39 protein [Mycena floridula]|nr:glycoside hydrolase family 39 protein [Mycena floridula]
MIKFGAIFLAISAISSGVSTIVPRQSSSQITFVDLATNTGTSVHRASGLLYGVPDNGNQIPSTFYTGMGFNYLSAGSAQDPAAAGWIFGGYTTRFQEALANYKTAKQFGAQFILKMSDLWGADGTQGTNAIYPGDDTTYAEYDRFLTQLVSDLKANSMTSLKMLIWNEPELSAFWTRGQARYLDMWSHTVKFLRANLAGVPIAGPSFAGQPSTSNTWWTAFLARVKADGTAPDVYTWHHESSAINDLQNAQPTMVKMLNAAGLAVGEFVIDEYGTLAEQCPSSAAWWISRLERFNMSGMRGNWLSLAQLHDFFASLLGKTDVNNPTGTGYFSNGEYQVYKYYASTMTGHRVATTGSGDRLMDSYAVVGTNIIRVLVGARQTTGTYMLQINNLSAVGLATSGTINVRTLQFSWAGKFGRVDAPTDLGLVAHTYSGNVLAFPIFQTDLVTTWAFEITF